jgi:hypothetical protein
MVHANPPSEKDDGAWLCLLELRVRLPPMRRAFSCCQDIDTYGIAPRAMKIRMHPRFKKHASS